MKIYRKIALWTIATMGLMVACSKDDTDNYADKVAGTYYGDVNVSMTMNGQTTDVATLAGTLVVATENNTHVSVTVPEVSYGSMSIPGFTISNVSVSNSKGTYLLTKEAFTATAGNLTVTGSLQGQLSDEHLLTTYTVAIGSMPHDLTFTFASHPNQ